MPKKPKVLLMDANVLIDYQKSDFSVLGLVNKHFAEVHVLLGVGSVMGATVAGAITMAIGYSYLHFFMKGIFHPSPDELKRVLKEQYQKARNRLAQLEQERKRNARG